MWSFLLDVVTTSECCISTVELEKFLCGKHPPFFALPISEQSVPRSGVEHLIFERHLHRHESYEFKSVTMFGWIKHDPLLSGQETQATPIYENRLFAHIKHISESFYVIVYVNRPAKVNQRISWHAVQCKQVHQFLVTRLCFQWPHDCNTT